MTPFTEIVAMTALFALRLGIPLAITFLIVWGLRRLDARWEADASARRAAAAVANGEVIAARLKSPMAAEKPCWSLRGCPESRKAGCPACADSNMPCWLARLRADGRLPGACYGCALFRTRRSLELAI
jgi:hypothetical protein